MNISKDIEDTKPLEDKVYEWLAGRADQPIYLEQPDIPLPKGYYVCMDCKQVTNYWKPGQVCYNCETEGERQMEQERGN